MESKNRGMNHKRYWSISLGVGICIAGILLWLAVDNNDPSVLFDKESPLPSSTQFIKYTLPDVKKFSSISEIPTHSSPATSALAKPTTTIAIPLRSTPYDSIRSWESRIIIQTHSHTNYDQGVLALIRSIEGVKSRRLDKLNITILEIPPHWDTNGVIDLLQNDPAVQLISIDVLMTSNRVPDDPDFPTQWGLVAADLPEAWETTQGNRSSTGVIVAIIDSGIDYTHPDLFANLWVNEIEQNGEPGQDDDDNGYVDDIYGVNATGGNNGDPWDSHSEDFGHGTYVASVIGAVGNNGRLISGVNWKTRLLAIKTNDFDGGFAFSAIVNSVNYLLTMKERGHNIRVINASFGTENLQNLRDSALIKLYDSILSDLNQQGILFIASSGNSGVDTSEPGRNNYPSNSPLENVISVGSIDRDGNVMNTFRDRDGNLIRIFHGNYSKTKVDLVAPGVEIPALRTASIENTYTITNLFSSANILCDDLEPPLPTGNRACDNPSADTSPRWTAENGWERTSDQAFNSQYSWGTDNENIPTGADPDAILTHQPISLKGYMTQSASVSIPAPIVFSFRYRAVTLPSTPVTLPLPTSPTLPIPPPPLPPLNQLVTIETQFLVNSQVEDRQNLTFSTGQPWNILAIKIPDFLYEHDNVQLQFVVAKRAGTQVYIDNIAITAIQAEDSERTIWLDTTGTSFSAPHVAGAAALLWSARPELHHLEVRDLLLDNVNDLGLGDYFVTGGSLNVAEAISAIDEIILELSTNSIVIPETQFREFTAVLKQAPETDSPITVTIEQGIDNQTNPAHLMIDPSELTFTAANWNDKQTIRVSSVADNTFQDLRNRLTFNVPASDGKTQQRYIDVLVTNTDTAELVGLSSLLVLDEGTSTTIDFQLHLSTNSTERFIVTFEEQSTVKHLRFDIPSQLSQDLELAGNRFGSVTIVSNNDNRLDNIETQIIVRAYLRSNRNNILLSEQIINVKIINTETLQILGLRDLVLDENASTILSVSLSVQPTETYTVSVSSPRTSLTEQFDLNVSPTTLIFTEQTWSNPQAVRITALADGRLADSSAVLTFQASPNNEPNNIQDEQTITVTVPNNEPLEILGLNNFILHEETSSTLFISLSLQPDRAYTVTIISTQINPPDNQCNLTIIPSTLAFDEQTWSSPQMVRINALADGRFLNRTCLLTFQAYPSNDPGTTPVVKTISVIIPNTESLLNLPDLIILDEDTSTILSVSLSVQPTETYTVTITSTQIFPPGDQSKLTVTTSTLVFDERTRSSSQAVQITAPADGKLVNRFFQMTFQAYLNNEPNIVQAEQTVTISVPNTEPLRILGLHDLSLDENTSTILSISFSLQPDRAYTVTIISTQNAQAGQFDLNVTPTALIFDAQTWSSPQAIQITAPVNNRFPDTATSLTFRAYPNNEPNNIQAEQTISIAVTNTETQQILGLLNLTLDENTSAILSVSLSVQPTETYTVRISSPRTSLTEQFDLNVSPTTLIFTEQTWSNPQAVRITAPADGRLADSSAVLTFQASPNNEPNNIRAEQTISIAVTNTETLKIFGLPDNLTLDENTPSTLFISLSLQPDRDYTVMNIPTSIQNELFRPLNVTPTTFTFNQQNWNRPQAVRITAPLDNKFFNAFSELMFTAYPKNEPEPIQASQTIFVKINNTETLQILGLHNLSLNENTSTILSISFSLQPNIAYTVTIISTQNAQTGQFDLSVTPTALIFDEQTWSTPQAIQITAPPDNRFANKIAMLTFRAYPNNEPNNVQSEQTITIVIPNTETLEILGLRDLTLDENSSATLSVSLSLQPLEEYIVVSTLSNIPALLITPTLSFDSQNWNNPQDLRITTLPAVNSQIVQTIIVTFLLYPKTNMMNIQNEEIVKVTVIGDDVLRFRIKIFLEGAQ